MKAKGVLEVITENMAALVTAFPGDDDVERALHFLLFAHTKKCDRADISAFVELADTEKFKEEAVTAAAFIFKHFYDLHHLSVCPDCKQAAAENRKRAH